MNNKDNTAAVITNIQRFSIHDGPGIRTTVFMKGCNLRCLWCHNPESQSQQPQKMLYHHKCVGCGACREICDKAFSAGCDSCGKCVAVCVHGARELAGTTVTVNSLFQEILKDRPFYDNSGGGVTFSGGEPLLQPDFLVEVLQRCNASSIHTAVETAGNVSWEVFTQVLPYVDLFLYDIKAIDPQVHKNCTGVSNERILANAQKLMRICPEKLLFRMPVIPGYNDTQVPAVAAFAGEISLELLPYHSTGMGKYQALGMRYDLEGVQAPPRETMEKLASEQRNTFWEGNTV